MANISQIKLPPIGNNDGVVYDIKDKLALSSIASTVEDSSIILTLTNRSGGNSTLSINSANTNSAGLMSKNDKVKLNSIEAGAEPNLVTSVKGNYSSESQTGIGNVILTKADIGLNNVQNKSSTTILNEITSNLITSKLGYTPLNENLKGVTNGVAELGSDGKVLASQLPSYVDDVVEGYYKDTESFYLALADGSTLDNPIYDEATLIGKLSDGTYNAEKDKIYSDKKTNTTYRWGGSSFVEISASIAIGESEYTAFRGDHGKVAYDHALSKGVFKDTDSVIVGTGFFKIQANKEGHIVSATPVTPEDITSLGIPGSDTNTSHTHTVGTGLTLTKQGEIDSSNGTQGTYTIALANTAVNPNAYGPAQGAELNYGSSFEIPYFNVDQQGRITSAASRTFTLPANTNEDTKVNQAYSTANGEYPLLASAITGISSTNTRGATTSILNNSIYINPSTGTLTATKVNTSVVKVGGATLTYSDNALVISFA